MSLHHVAEQLKARQFEGLFPMAGELREHLDTEVVGTFCSGVFHYLSQFGNPTHIPLFKVVPVEKDHNSFEVKFELDGKAAKKPFSKHFYFIFEHGHYSVCGDRHQHSLI